MHVPAELYGSLRKRVNVFAREAKRVFAGDIDALHRTRIASRRLRELVPVLHLDAATTRKLRRRLRKATRLLGTVRDFDVLTGLISTLLRDPRHSRIALMALRTELQAARMTAFETLEANLPPRKLQKLARRLKRVAKHIEPAEADEPQAEKRQTRTSVWALDALVVRRARLVAEAIAAAGTVYSPQALHDVRVSIKKLRYAVELQTEARGERGSSEVATLESCQDLLGRLHDFQVLIEHAARLQGSLSAGERSFTELSGLVQVLERDCRQVHARYIRGCPKLLSIVRRLEKSRSSTKHVPGSLPRSLLRRLA